MYCRSIILGSVEKLLNIKLSVSFFYSDLVVFKRIEIFG